MKNFWKKWRIAIISVAYAGVLISLVWFVIIPLVNALNDKADYIKQTMVDRDNRQKRLGELGPIREQIELINAEEGNIKAQLPKDRAVSLIEDLENLAETTNNKIIITMGEDAKSSSKAKPADAKAKDASDIFGNLPSNEYIRMKLKLVGSYDQFINFIWKLENMQYYSDVISMQINSNVTAAPNNDSSTGVFNDSSNPFSNENLKVKQKATNNGQEIESVLDVVFYLEK